MASMADILTTAQNVAQGINNIVQTYLNVQGAQNSGSLTTATVVKAKPGRLCTVVVTVAGAAAGSIYDAILPTATTNKMYVIPATLGVYVVNVPANYGIVAAPGSGQTIMVSFS